MMKTNRITAMLTGLFGSLASLAAFADDTKEPQLWQLNMTDGVLLRRLSGGGLPALGCADRRRAERRIPQSTRPRRCAAGAVVPGPLVDRL